MLRTLTISANERLRLRLKEIAEENNTTVSGMINRWAYEYQLKSERNPNGREQ